MFGSEMCVLLVIIAILSKSQTIRTAAVQKTRLAKFESYMVGGNYARIEDFPHSAFLTIGCPPETGQEFACGSSVINQKMLLTAAHCLEDCKPGSRIDVLVGTEDKNLKAFHEVESFVIHALYDSSNFKNDLAVALLERPLELSKTVKRIMLSKKRITDQPAMVAGWGITDEAYGTDSQFLRYASQRVFQRSRCLSVLPFLSQGFICTSPGRNRGGYASVGDSGSALIVRGFIQIGLVSHKVVEISTSYVVYTDVTYYYKWIARTTKYLYCQQ